MVYLIGEYTTDMDLHTLWAGHLRHSICLATDGDRHTLLGKCIAYYTALCLFVNIQPIWSIC